MTFVVKLGHKRATRRLTFAEQPTWAVLSAKIAEVCKLNANAVAVSYFDSENDQVTLSSEGELADYYAHYLPGGEIAHLTVQVATSPTVTVEDDNMTDLLKDVDIPKSVNSESEWQDVQSPGRAADDTRSEGYGSTFWGGLEEAFRPANARLYDPEGANIIASFAAVRTHPDVLFDISRHLSPRSTATLIQVMDDSDASETEMDFSLGHRPIQPQTHVAPPTPPAHPTPLAVPASSPAPAKGKAKEVAFDHAIPTANVSSAQSVRGSAADPRDIEAPIVEAAPEPVAVPVIHQSPAVPPIEVKFAAEVAPDPPIPTVPPAIPTVPAPERSVPVSAPTPNLVADIAGLINAFQTVLQTQPDIGASLRRFIRSAVEGSPPSMETQKEASSPAQLKEVIKTLKDSIAAQSAADPTEDRNADLAGEVPTHSRGPLYQPPPGPPPPQAEHGHRHHHHHRPGSRHSHRTRAPPPPPPPEMGGGPAAPLVPSLRGLPRPMPPPPPGTAVGVWLAPADRMSPFLYYQPFVPHDGVPPPPPPPRHHHGHHHKQSRHSMSRCERSPSRRSVSSPFPGAVPLPVPPPQGFMPPPPPRLAPPAGPARASPIPAISVVPGPVLVPAEQQLVTVPTAAPPEARPPTHEEALVALSEQKTQLELAKERYRIEKQKWREEKEARRAARDREIERLTGRRVLGRDEREARRALEFEETPVLAAPIVPSLDNPYAHLDKKMPSGEPMFGLFSAGLNSANPADNRPAPGLPSPRPTTLTEPPPYAVPSPRNRNRAGTGLSPTHTRPGGASPIQDLKPGSAMAIAAQAERIIDRLEDMGFSPSTHPRFQEIVREQLNARPGATDEEALPYIMEAIVAHAPSGSGTGHHDY